MSVTHLSLIKDSLSEKHFISYSPALSHVVGSVNAALLIGYLLFWQGQGHRSDGYIYKTAEDMHRETGLTENQQRTAINLCKKEGFLSVRLKGIPATRHFKIDVDKLMNLISSSPKTTELLIGKSRDLATKNQPSNTESTREIAREIHRLHELYLHAFSRTNKECRLTDARKLLLLRRLQEFGYEGLCRAIDAAARSDFWTGYDDDEFKGTIEKIFKDYERVEGFIYGGS